ncbi:hypothetical protein [Chroococcus sp. FPU101]|uniref:hypothetical protein n=1 Tax=Chroococcus sp. FPU101 TaxID=1974212 RepID=UPI001A8C2DAB|nr:hypothetical protein [Chroococcus sp. FPU101]GFE67769.1 hypothetical protein CFPU101_03790 [Chroococcus sp. FPU101]
MLLLVITKPITSLLDTGIVPEVIENIPTIVEEVAKAIPTQKLVAHWVKDETGKLMCRWLKQ